MEAIKSGGLVLQYRGFFVPFDQFSLKEMSNQREKITIRNIIGGNRNGGKREKKKGKIEKNKVGCTKELT